MKTRRITFRWKTT